MKFNKLSYQEECTIFEELFKKCKKWEIKKETNDSLVKIFNIYEKEINEIISLIKIKEEIKNDMQIKDQKDFFELPNTVIFHYLLKTLNNFNFQLCTIKEYYDFFSIVYIWVLKTILKESINLYKNDLNKYENLLLNL